MRDITESAVPFKCELGSSEVQVLLPRPDQRVLYTFPVPKHMRQKSKIELINWVWSTFGDMVREGLYSHGYRLV